MTSKPGTVLIQSNENAAVQRHYYRTTVLGLSDDKWGIHIPYEASYLRPVQPGSDQCVVV